MFRALLALSLLIPAVPAFAGDDPVEFVRTFYVEPIADERDLSLYTSPALETFERNRVFEEASGEVGCLDFSIPLDSQDWDDDEIAASLKLSKESDDGKSAVVRVDFSIFDEGRAVVWTLVRNGDGWLVSDVASPTSDWQLSELCKDM